MKRWQIVVIGVVITVATLAYVLRGNDFSQIGAELARANYLFVMPTSLLVLLGLVLRALRWRVLLNDQISVPHSFHITNIGYFFNAWLPFRLGEVARSYLVTRLDPPLSMFTSLSSVVVERLTDLLMVVILVIVAITIAPVTQEIIVGTQISGAIALGGMVVLAVFAVRRDLAHGVLNGVLRLLPFLERFNLRRIADRVLDGIAPLGSIMALLRAFFWALLAWGTSVFAGFMLMYAFYDEPSWGATLLMIAVASIAIALPAVPGSFGPFEAAVYLGMDIGGMINPSAGLPAERAIAYAVVLHAQNIALYAFLGVIGLSYERISFGEVIRTARQIASRQSAQPDMEQ